MEQRRRQVTAMIRAVSFVIGLLAVSGVAHAQMRLDVLAAFGPAGLQNPQAPLIQGTDGNFYGTTVSGGTFSAGTVFQLTPAGTLTVLYAFTGGTDGAGPVAGVIQAADGNFYGTTSQGGASNAGTVFQLTPAGALTVLYAFTGGSTDGATPYARLIQGTDGNFYGTTVSGGTSNAGTVFQLTPAGTLTVLYAFTGGPDGATPYAGLIQATDGNFYGTTVGGGTSSAGTVFQLTPAGAVSVLYAFTGGANGATPFAGLIQATDGNFYGTTVNGGASSAGTVFQLTPAGAVSVLHAFTGGADGATPFAGLIQATDGSFYGTTAYGGASSAGTVFQLTPAGAVSVLYAFTGETDGAAPVAGVIQATDGSFYGVTQSGGALGGGTAFRLRSAIPTTITWNPPASIEYGTALSATQLDATASVPGTFVYMPPAGTVLQAGPQTLAATFTPTDTNYAIATGTVTLTVTAAAPVITWNPPASIAYGRALSGRELNATANVSGTFAYSPPAGTVFGVGTQTLSVTFTPTDGTDYTPATSSVTLTVTPVATTTTSGGGNEYPLQFTPGAGYRGLVVAGYQLVANSFGGYTVLGNCSYYTVQSGSGRGGGYRTITTHHDQTCTWDLYGNLLTVIPGAPVVPAPLSVNGTQTVYAANAQGVFTGSDSALRFGGFVYTPGSHFSWLTPNPYTVLSQTVYTVTATLKSDGDMPLSISSVQASALRGIVTVSSNTCTGQIPVGSTCAVTVTYDPTRLRSATGLAYDTLDISVISDAGQFRDFVQSYTIVLNQISDD